MTDKYINPHKYIFIVATILLCTLALIVFVRYYSEEYKNKYTAEYDNMIVKRELVDMLHMNIIEVERKRFSMLSVSNEDELQDFYKEIRTGLAEVRQVYFLLKKGGIYTSEDKTIEYHVFKDLQDEALFEDIELSYIQFFQYFELVFKPGKPSAGMPLLKKEGTYKVNEDNLEVLRQLDSQVFKLYSLIGKLNNNTNRQIRNQSALIAETNSKVSMFEMIAYVLIISAFFVLIVKLFFKLKKVSQDKLDALKAVSEYSGYISNVFDSLPIGVLIVDQYNEVKQFNAQLKNYFPNMEEHLVKTAVKDAFLSPFQMFQNNDKPSEIIVRLPSEERSFLSRETEFDLRGEKFKVVAYVDINRRKQVEKQIQIQNSIFHEINFVSDEFMKSQDVDFAPIEILLEKTGSILQASRVVLYEFEYDGSDVWANVSKRWETNKAFVLRNIGYEKADWFQNGLKRWLQLFENGLELSSFYKDLLAEERQCLRGKQFEYIHAFPLFINTKLYGFVSYEAVNENSSVVNMDKSLSSALRMTFEALVERKKYDEIIKFKNAELLSYSEELEAQSDTLKEQNVEMAYQRQKVEEANKLKSEFMANMSHELRTPMNAIIGISKMLIKYNATNLTDKQLDGLQLIGDSGKRLLDLINDILDLSKVDSGKMELKQSWVMLEKLISTVIKTYAPLASEKGVELLFIKDERFVEKIYVDEAKLLSILTNLVGNALKFTDTGSVTISSYLQDNQIYFDVSDTGIGISAENFDVIFDEFKQIDGSHAKKYPGTGLGLALSKKLVDLLGGEISVESTIDKGSIFSFYVPFDYESAGIVNNLIVKEVKNSDTKSVKAKSKVHMLIVEDDYNNLYLYSEYVSSLNYQIKYAKNGKEAMHSIEELWPDIIILDLNIPKISGFDILRYLETIAEEKYIPVIVISATENSEINELQYFEFIKKPVSEDVFLQSVQSAVNYIYTPKVKRSGKPKVLVVDDEKIGRTTVQMMLEGRFELYFAKDGAEAVEAVKVNPPDIILMDIMMPVMDGYDAYAQIRSLYGNAIPVIALTAKAMKSERSEILSKGFDAYISKPVDDEMLVAQINEMVQRDTRKPA